MYQSITRVLTSLALATLTWSTVATAHHPDRQCQSITPRVDVIGPLGNNLPPGYRRQYNRPHPLAGWISYWIAPSSQEAMVWHKAKHAGYYESPKKECRWEKHYFYPKPYDSLLIGNRRSLLNPPENEELSSAPGMMEEDADPSSEATEAPLELEDTKLEDTELELPPLRTMVPGPEPVQPESAPAEALPESIDASEGASPSDVLSVPQLEPATPSIQDSSTGNLGEGVEFAVGSAVGRWQVERQGVSHANVSRRAAFESTLEVADKPVFLRRLLR